MPKQTLLEVKQLRKWFPIRKGFRNKIIGHVRAVDDVSFTIQEGETLGLVGESGCGKTTTGRCIIRAIDPTAGQVLFHRGDEVVDLVRVGPEKLRALRQEIRMIFQDPYSSLNPRMTVRDIIAEPLVVNNVAQGSELEERVVQLLQKVGLRPEYMQRYPHAFSGGQRQRIGIARALALNPRLVICDEPVSALDVSVQAQILNLLQELQEQMNLTYLFIAHDLGVVEHISDRIAVMYVGKIVEITEAEELFAHPLHPYTESLLSSAPIPDPKRRSDRSRRSILQGEVADAGAPPSGCYFHPRCPYSQKICKEEYPQLRQVGSTFNGVEHFAACHFAGELELRGVPMDDLEIRAGT